jgi:hypothetical protein
MLRYNRWARAVFDRLSRGKARRKQAVVALARKVLVRCWAMLRDGVPWRPPDGQPDSPATTGDANGSQSRQPEASCTRGGLPAGGWPNEWAARRIQVAGTAPLARRTGARARIVECDPTADLGPEISDAPRPAGTGALFVPPTPPATGERGGRDKQRG